MTVTRFLFSLDGRISRRQYWCFFVLPISIPLLALNIFLQMKYPSESSLIRLIIALPFWWISVCVMGKRWHDRDKSAWWVLILLIPIVGGLWFLIEGGFLKGTDGPNRFGDDPTTNS